MKTLSVNPPVLQKVVGPARTFEPKIKLLVILVLLADVSGNSSMSWGLRHQGALFGVSPLVYVRLIFNPWIVLGTTLLVVWLLSRMILLGWADLSFVLPITSFSYVFNELTGHYLLGEQIPWPRWVGTIMITAGAAVVGLTRSNTTGEPRGAA